MPNIFDILLVHSHRECADTHFALFFVPVSTIFHHFVIWWSLLEPKRGKRESVLENFSCCLSARPNLQQCEQWQLIPQCYQVLYFSLWICHSVIWRVFLFVSKLECKQNFTEFFVLRWFDEIFVLFWIFGVNSFSLKTLRHFLKKDRKSWQLCASWTLFRELYRRKEAS